MADFDGKTYSEKHDKKRLAHQLSDVRRFMLDGKWRTLREIQEALGYPQASISARLRDLRKDKFGAFEVARRRRGPASLGLFEYQVRTQPDDAGTEIGQKHKCVCPECGHQHRRRLPKQPLLPALQKKEQYA